MASQIGVTRVYTTTEETTDTRLKACTNCKVTAVPRGITDTGMNGLGNQETHCPNCGHIHGRKNH